MDKIEEPVGALWLYTDGASRGNPGLAGAGILITDSMGNTLVEKSVFLGETTNNVAEYRALIIGLEEAAKLSPAHLLVQMDSELAVKQLNGDYRVKNVALARWHQQALELLRRFVEVQIRHISREKNRSADRLANLAIDRESE